MYFCWMNLSESESESDIVMCSDDTCFVLIEKILREFIFCDLH